MKLRKHDNSRAVKFLFAVLCLFAAAQAVEAAGAKRKPARARLPRVGTIKNYEATGMMTGCGNLYFYPVKWPVKREPEDFIFLARAGGQGAWMNLDGRDVRLVLVKTTTWYKGEDVTRSRSDYRAGATRISVLLDPRVSADSETMNMLITVRRGRAARTYRAEGSSDC